MNIGEAWSILKRSFPTTCGTVHVGVLCSTCMDQREALRVIQEELFPASEKEVKTAPSDRQECELCGGNSETVGHPMKRFRFCIVCGSNLYELPTPMQEVMEVLVRRIKALEVKA